MLGRILPLAFLLACAAPATVAAEWIVSPYIGARFGASTNLLVGREGAEESKVTFGSSVGFLSNAGLGVEADIAFIPGFFSKDLSVAVTSSLVTTLMGNVILAAPLEMTQYGLRPYATGGLGVVRARGDDAFEPVISSNLLGFNIGGGAIGPLSPRTSLRLDLRYMRNLGGDSDATTADADEIQLSFWRGTVGFTFRF